MAVTHVSSIRASGAGFQSSLTAAIDAGTSDNRAVVVFTTQGTSTTMQANSATYGGVAMTAGTVFTPASGYNKKMRAFWLSGASVPTGTNDVVVTYSDAGGRPELNAHTFHSVDSISGETTGSGGAAASGSITITSAVGDLGVIMLVHDGATGSVTPGTGVTETLDLIGTNYTHWAGYKDGAVSLTLGFSFPGNRSWAGVALSLAAAAPAGPPTIDSVTTTDTTATVSWTGVADEYRINGGSAQTLSDTVSPATITGLTADLDNYTIELRHDAGDWSDPYSFGTANPATGGNAIEDEPLPTSSGSGFGIKTGIGVGVGIAF